MGKQSRRANRRNRKAHSVLHAIGNGKPREDIFTGETMTCVMCGAQQRSDPSVNSDWRAIEWNELTYYACPHEFPPDGAGQEAFTQAYLRVLEKISQTYAKQIAAQSLSAFTVN